MESPTTTPERYASTRARVAIVGRPNVGKSTLFNRLIRKRKSITDPHPGVTRDPVFAEARLKGRSLLFIDTGGLTESKDYLDRLITRKSLETLEQAELLLFVLDVEAVSPEDEEFMKRLRQFNDRLILVVNKVDNEKRQAEAYEYYSYGFSRLIPVSATHGIGIEELEDEILKMLAVISPIEEIVPADKESAELSDGKAPEWEEGREPLARKPGKQEPGKQEPEYQQAENREPAGPRYEDQEPEYQQAGTRKPPGPGYEDQDPEDSVDDTIPDGPWDISIAVLGQPNTGKSTLTNLLTGTENSIVSSVAGTTRDVIEGLFRYKDKLFRILDTAGIRRKSRVSENLEYYSVNRAIATVNEADVVFLMIDVEKGLVEQDKKIAAQIVKKGRGVILVANKWDLLEPQGNMLNAVTDRIRFLFPVLEFAPVLPLSALKGEGVKDLLDIALKIHTQLQKRVETALLNSSLRRWIERTPPPQNAKHRWKIRYITQVSKHPVQFVLFVNKSKGFPDSYLGYIRNQIRKEFGFSSIPIQIELRDRR